MRKLFAFLTLVCAAAAPAAVFDHLPTDAELVNRADLVAIGTIRHAASRVRPDNGWVITDYELAVEETLKGTAAPAITLTEVGGVADGWFTVISDAATYRSGERVLVFLHRASDGTYYTASMKLGKFEFTRNAQGASVLVRDTGEFGPEPARLEREFKEFVRGAAATKYQTTLRPVAAAFQPKAEVITPADYCETATAGSETHPLRWPGGESGLTVPFLSTAADPGGIAPGAAEWTNEPAAFITLSYNGVSASIGSAPSFDSKNGIYLNYTGSVPPGIPCSDGIACAIESGNSTHVFQSQTFFSISDADILVFPSGMGGAFNAAIVHELGHAIGFRHSNQGTPNSSVAVMNSSVSFTSLQQWDRDAADTVYGSGPPCQSLSITSQPGDTTVPAGSTTTLQVIVNGTNPSYQWYDGVKPDTSNPVSGATNATFTTPPINSVKKYWVRVTNSCSTVDSNTATVTPQAPPECTPPHVTQQPAGGTINSGQSFILAVQFTGSGPFTVQWYEGNAPDKTVPVPGATSPTFTTPALTQTKSYWVDVVNPCGEDKSATAVVTVHQPGQCNAPVFTIQPQSVAGQSGHPAILFALATGDAPISYQWFEGPVGDLSSFPITGLPPSNARWISQIYVDLLGRTPTTGEVAPLTALLGGGASRPTAALTLLGSTEYRTNLLGSFFAQYLHRAPAAADNAFFMPMFTAGFTDEQVAAQIIGSTEYFVLAGGTNSAFITRLFNDVLGRAPSAADMTFYLTLLGSTSRINVALNVLNSSEARTRLIQSYFTRFLRRSATSGEAAGLLGGSDEQAIAAILGSDEYFNFASLLVTRVLTQTANFWVRATNGCGTKDSTPATVRIDCPLPVITTQPPSVSVNVGQAPTIAVIATGATSYQWFVGSPGVETSPIAGSTGAVLNTLVVNTVGTTSVWVKVTNGCGSVNSNAAIVTVNCGATKPLITAPPISPSTKSYPISWTGNLGSDSKYELQESTTPDFTGNLKTVTITDGTSNIIAAHAEVAKDTRFYYRVRSFTRCPTDPSAYSTTASVLVTAPLARNLSDYSFAQLPCGAPPCLIQQIIHLDGFSSLGKIGVESTDSFSVSSDKPWITVSPSSGNLPAEGADVTVTIDASQLDVGSSQATLTETRTQGAAKVGTLGNPPPKSVPVNVSLVAPVTPKPKDGNAQLNALLIPATAHADGIGTRFVTDMRLTNTATQSITYDLTFTPSNIDGTTSGKQVTVNVAAGQSLALNDLVKDWFGSGTEGEVGIGSVEIRPRNFAAKTTPVNVAFATVASSRTYAVASTGTFGQYIPALPIANFLSKGSNSVISLQQVAQSASYRTNLGLAEGLGQAANVVVTLFDDKGMIVAQKAVPLKPFESPSPQQLGAFFNGAVVGGGSLPNIADGRLEVSVTSDTGKVTAYASVLDNATQDPLLVFPVDPSLVSAKRFVVPGVAEFDSGFSNFHTDMRVYNAASTDANVTINFSGSVSLPAVQRTIPAGQVLAVDNVLGTLWNAANGVGAVNITTASDAQLVVTARTFSRDANGGTFGQFIPGVTAADAVGVGDRALNVVQLEQSPQFRSNLGLVEVTGNPVTVEITGFTPDSKVAAHVEKTLAGGEFSQPGSIFTQMGFGDVYNGRISVRAIGGTGKVAVYGSVVDNRTADPTYVPAQ
jgi:hypothetical protein